MQKSSVYGGNTNLPFSESQNVDHPVSLYAATKSNELIAHSYSHLYNIKFYWIKILYCLWSMGKTRYGIISFY